jgi:short-subunit dehydrogenase
MDADIRDGALPDAIGNQEDLMGKPVCALITGASSGIGEAFARVMAAEGINLVLMARRAERLEALRKELEPAHRVKVMVVPCDVRTAGARADAWEKARKAAAEASMQIDCLVNNAGLGQSSWFVKQDWDRKAEMIDVNISALTHFASLALPHMAAANRGWICNVSSTASFLPGPKMAVYYATKAYVTSLSEALSHEVRHSNVKISALCPGPVKTEFAPAAKMESSRLFQIMKPMTSEKVARVGYAAMLRGQPVAIDSWMLAVAMFMNRFVPRAMIVRTAAFLNGAGGRRK